MKWRIIVVSLFVLVATTVVKLPSQRWWAGAALYAVSIAIYFDRKDYSLTKEADEGHYYYNGDGWFWFWLFSCFAVGAAWCCWSGLSWQKAVPFGFLNAVLYTMMYNFSAWAFEEMSSKRIVHANSR